MSCFQCKKGVKVHHGTPKPEYTYEPHVFGHFPLQKDQINGRAYFKKGEFAIWWDGNAKWWIGIDSAKGQPKGFAYVIQDVFCIHTVTDWVWKIVWAGGEWKNAEQVLGVKS